MRFSFNSTCVNLIDDIALFAVDVYLERTKVGDLRVLVNDEGKWNVDGYMDESLTSFDCDDAARKAGELCATKAQIVFNTSKRQQNMNIQSILLETDCQ